MSDNKYTFINQSFFCYLELETNCYEPMSAILKLRDSDLRKLIRGPFALRGEGGRLTVEIRSMQDV